MSTPEEQLEAEAPEVEGDEGNQLVQRQEEREAVESTMRGVCMPSLFPDALVLP